MPSHHPEFRSAAVTHEFDAELGLTPEALAVLNAHDFYERSWPPTVAAILNRRFQAAIAHFSYRSLVEVSAHFEGRIIARAFGRESPRRYTEFLHLHPGLLQRIGAIGERFVFGQGYDNLAEVEAPELASRAHTIAVPLPAEAYRHADTWHGGGAAAVFLCPAIEAHGYYGTIYRGIKRDFGDLPHVIFGRQHETIDDPAILPYLTEAELFALYAAAPVFVYPHTEPRHVHYSPLEAMVVGTPTLYLRSALIGALTHDADLPGACADIAEMHEKARRLLAGDHALAAAIRAGQGQVLGHFSLDVARRQWAEVLGGPAGETV